MNDASMNRRRFLHLSIASGLVGVGPAAAAWSVQTPTSGRELLAPQLASGVAASLSLTAAAGNYDLGAGARTGGLLFNQSWPSPTLRVNQGEVFDLTLINQLSEPTIVHWHGLTPPADMDGHPNSVIAAGTSRPYRFTVNNRAGTYWYHPHPHERTAYQAYLGLAGFLLVSDGQDAARGLPTGARDLPLLLADKRLNGGTLQYSPGMADMMSGFLGNAVLVNGRLAPTLAVEPAVVRLRLLNGSNARILNPAFADGRSFWLIGTDAGLLSAPVAVTSVLLAPGERVEVLLDLRGSSGQNVDFVSAPFSISAMNPPSAPAQGSGFDLMRFQVTLPLSGPPGEIPIAFEPVPAPTILSGPVRQFQLTQSGPQHLINGLVFDMNRVDFRVAQGSPEIWRFVNSGSQPHPMHVHAAQFRVLSRSGPALPTDAGLKDTVLVRVGESVDVSLRFDVPGLFVVHCHNLEHEDNGMMLNFVVEGSAVAILDSGYTGTWYDPAQSGHGIFIEILPGNLLLAYWFTFTPQGQQAWFGGVGPITGNTAAVSVVQTQGGRFIPNFDPAQVTNLPWGTLNFTFTDCQTGKVDFNSTVGFGIGSMTLKRLTSPAGLFCTSPLPAVKANP